MLKLFQRFHAIIADPTTIKVPAQDFRISQQPLVSSDYRDCNGIVLIGREQACVTHYSPLAEPLPHTYLDECLRQMQARGELRLEALVVAGDPLYFRMIVDALQQRNIPLVGGFYDNWPEGISPPWDAQSKDIVVIPKTQEVILSTVPVGYVTLH